METKIERLKINVGCGRSATVTVKENRYVTIAFSNDNEGMCPINLSEHPELITNAFSEIMKEYHDYEPKCLLYQANDWVMYLFKRIL